MPYPRPVPGRPSAPLVDSAQYHRDIIDLLAAYKRGDLTRIPPAPRRDPQIRIKSTASDASLGEILQIDAMTAPPASDHIAWHRSPILEAKAPEWHTDIDRIAVCRNPVPNDSVFPYNPYHFASVKITVVKNTDRWVMVDPDTPTQCKTADAGIYKILGLDETNNLAVCDLNQSQPLWHFELTQDAQTHPDTTEAKLVRLDGDDFTTGTDRVQLSDRTGMLEDTGAATGTIGQCLHVGNEFLVIDVKC